MLLQIQIPKSQEQAHAEQKHTHTHRARFACSAGIANVLEKDRVFFPNVRRSSIFLFKNLLQFTFFKKVSVFFSQTPQRMQQMKHALHVFVLLLMRCIVFQRKTRMTRQQKKHAEQKKRGANKQNTPTSLMGNINMRP